ncbi:MAG TPA: ATP-binding protein [Planctomycetota bacterium]|nr:ATP-binding protein [Planctomycetota bacterium]
MTNAGASVSHQKILLVDDRSDKLLALESVLADLGHGLVRAGSGEDALRAVLAEDFALILMDVYMPGMSGIETARLIRARERSVHTPILFFTALGLERTLEREAYAIGAVDIIAAPVERHAIRAKVAAFVELARLRRVAEDRSRDVLEQLDLIVEQTGDGIIMADEKGVIRIFNPAAEAQHGVTKQEISAPGWADAYGLFALDGRKLPLEETPLYRAVIGERVQNASWLVRKPSGEMVYLTGTATPLRRADGSRAGAVLVTRDETQARRAAEELAAQALELRRSNEELDRFASAASHDLKAPLRTIASYTGLVEKRSGAQLDERTRGFLATIRDAADRMYAMVDGFLIYARLGAGPGRRERVQLDEVAASVRESLAHQISESGATVAFAQLPPVTGDAAAISQLLQNLIENAIKYRGADPPRVDIRARQDGERWLITVADNGPGIPEVHREKIFEPFVQLQSGANNGSGSGIGLATCRRIVERHGGRIWVDANPDGGSHFRFTLPAASG